MNLQPRQRAPLLVLGFVALVAGTGAGLVRMGWELPTPFAMLVALHGPLMMVARHLGGELLGVLGDFVVQVDRGGVLQLGVLRRHGRAHHRVAVPNGDGHDAGKRLQHACECLHA